MRFHRLGYSILTLSAALLSLSASAKSRHIKPQEIFPATDPAEDPVQLASVTPPTTTTTTVTVSSPAPGAVAAPQLMPAPTKLSRAEAPHSTTGASTEIKYDKVPSDQVQPITERLKVVEVLLRVHGRAYDYRMHTLKDLQLELARLEKSSHTEMPTAAAEAKPAAPSEPVPSALPVPTEQDEIQGVDAATRSDV